MGMFIPDSRVCGVYIEDPSQFLSLAKTNKISSFHDFLYKPARSRVRSFNQRNTVPSCGHHQN